MREFRVSRGSGTSGVAAIAGLCLVLSGCSSAPDGNASTSRQAAASSGTSTLPSEITLAGTIPLAGNEFWQSYACGGSAAAEDAGAKINWFSSTSASDNALIARSVSAAVLSNPDGVVLAPAGSVDNTATLRALADKNVPVVETNSRQGSPYYQAVLSPEHDPNISALAHMIVESTGGSGTVGVLAGEAAVPAISLRWEPLVAAIKAEAPNLNVLPTQFDNFDASKAQSIVSAMILAHPDLKAVYDTSGPEAPGVAAAVKRAGKSGSIGVYSFDATPEEVALLKDGTITALLSQSPYNMAGTAVKNLVALLRERGSSSDAIGTASQPVVETPTKILLKDNLGDADSDQYLYKTHC